jgi:hypothetical protein
MMRSSDFWRKQVFTLVSIGAILFVLLTAAAMLLYPGGTVTDPVSRGYSFFMNFFSELGFVRSHTGGPKVASSVLFMSALTMAGAGLALFFIAFPQFFRRTPSGRMLSLIGSLFGVISGVCFIGIAFAPADLYRQAHIQFTLWAFRAFPVAALFYSIAIWREPAYPRRFAAVFLVFGILLVLYIFLIALGPGMSTPQGVMIQATGQKIIVYASILSILVQAVGARKIAQEGLNMVQG